MRKVNKIEKCRKLHKDALQMFRFKLIIARNVFLIRLTTISNDRKKVANAITFEV